jgi:hypothetical protein
MAHDVFSRSSEPHVIQNVSLTHSPGNSIITLPSWHLAAMLLPSADLSTIWARRDYEQCAKDLFRSGIGGTACGAGASNEPTSGHQPTGCYPQYPDTDVQSIPTTRHADTDVQSVPTTRNADTDVQSVPTARHADADFQPVPTAWYADADFQPVPTAWHADGDASSDIHATTGLCSVGLPTNEMYASTHKDPETDQDATPIE